MSVLVEHGGHGGSAAAPSLSVGWTSADIAPPTAAVVVNGVLFAASTGSATARLLAI
mgnify:CR=1 FL=1